MTTTADVPAARFVITTGALTPDDENLVTRFLQTEGQAIEWWHYLPGVWLVVDSKERTAEDWFDRLCVLIPDAQVLLFDLSQAAATWFKGHPRACDWLNERWGIPAPGRDEVAAAAPAADDATAPGGRDASAS